MRSRIMKESFNVRNFLNDVASNIMHKEAQLLEEISIIYMQKHNINNPRNIILSTPKHQNNNYSLQVKDKPCTKENFTIDHKIKTKDKEVKQ